MADIVGCANTRATFYRVHTTEIMRFLMPCMGTLLYV